MVNFADIHRPRGGEPASGADCEERSFRGADDELRTRSDGVGRAPAIRGGIEAGTAQRGALSSGFEPREPDRAVGRGGEKRALRTGGGGRRERGDFDRRRGLRTQDEARGGEEKREDEDQVFHDGEGIEVGGAVNARAAGAG